MDNQQQEVTIRLSWSGEHIRFHLNHSIIQNQQGSILMCLARGIVDYAAENTQKLITFGEAAFEKDFEQQAEAGKPN